MMVQSILFLSVSSTRFSKKLYQEYIKTFKTFKVILKKEKNKIFHGLYFVLMQTIKMASTSDQNFTMKPLTKF